MAGTPRLIQLITAINIGVSFFVWMPTWRRIFANRSSDDISVWTLIIVEWLQVSNFAVAVAERAWGLAAYLAVNASIVGLTMAIVAHFRRHRD